MNLIGGSVVHSCGMCPYCMGDNTFGGPTRICALRRRNVRHNQWASKVASWCKLPLDGRQRHLCMTPKDWQALESDVFEAYLGAPAIRREAALLKLLGGEQ